MADQIAAGDVVQLKSGGPLMTVRWVQDDYGTETAYCNWFDNNKENGAKYLPAQLRKVSDDDL